MMRARRMSLLLGLVGGPLLLLVGCASNPVTGKNELNLYSEAEEVAMGREAAEEVRASVGLVDAPELQAYVQGVGLAMARESERPDLPWSFQVVDDPEVNAFALPGGFIFVTRGILAHLGSDAELAGVIGHEIGHVTARHSVHELSKQSLALLGLGIGAAISERVGDLAAVATVGLQVLFLHYSRNDERQADALGLRYMTSDGWDPRAMPDVFGLLDRVSSGGGGGRLPNWLSSHPDPGARRETAEAAVAQLDVAPDARRERDDYLRRLDGLVFGEDPREGYFEGQTFYHPGLSFEVTFPPGWTTVNEKTRVAAVNPDETALIEVTLTDAASPAAAAEAFFSEDGLEPDAPRRQRVNGLPAQVQTFTVAGGEEAAASEDDGDELAGIATFVACPGRAQGESVFQIVGYGRATAWPDYEAAVDRAVTSFARLTDRRRLERRPNVLAIVSLPRTMTVTEFARRYPSTVGIEQLVLLNGLAGPDERLEAGRLVRRVVAAEPRVP